MGAERCMISPVDASLSVSRSGTLANFQKISAVINADLRMS
jgi:hypothetical protein